jgi:hypothetical protein
MMHLRLIVDGANDQQLSRGLKEAVRVFNAAGVDPNSAARANSHRALPDDLFGFDFTAVGCRSSLTYDGHHVADAWIEANQAAVGACCAGWTATPQDAGLSLVRNLPAVRRRGPYIEFQAG